MNAIIPRSPLASSKAAGILALVTCLLAASPWAAQNPPSLAAARALYDAAAYADALSMLDGLPQNGRTREDAVEVGKYRAFCLLALGRTNEAQQAIEEILAAQPEFRLSENEVSRRIYTVFEETRQRVLPQLARRVYDRAKGAYDRQEMQQAREDFALVVKLAEEPATGADAALVKDMATLARGFLNLIIATAPPVPAKAVTPASRLLPATKYIYDASDEGVRPPVVVDQRVPPWPSTIRPLPGATGVVEIVINERGEVESAVMAPPFNSPYDETLVAAAKRWRYKPATFAGQPVRFLRRVQVVAASGGYRDSPRPDGNGVHPSAR